MGVRKDLRQARRRPDLVARFPVRVVREDGVVREAHTPLPAGPEPSGTPADIPFGHAADDPGAIVMRRREHGNWRPVTAAEFAGDVLAVAKGLIAAGVEPGGRVGLMARTGYAWAVLDFAIWSAGGQTVPVYPTSSPDQVAWILHDSGTRHVVTESAEHTATVAEAAATLPEPVRTWQTDTGGLAELAALGAEIGDEVPAGRRAALTPDTVATLCYTSGTTGRPKGCALTHGNLHAEARATVELLHPVFEAVTGQPASTLLFLPLAHILGRMIQLACLMARIEIGQFPSIKPDELRPELRRFRPTFVVGVPYLFEKIHDTGRATAEKLGRGASFDRADSIAVRYGEASLSHVLGQGPRPGAGLTAAHALYDLLVYRRIRKELGGNLRYAISGGSPLDSRLSHFFYASGVLVYEGYGLTETSAAATVTPPLRPRPGTVGRPVPGTGVRIADDGEVLLKGPIVFTGYWNNPEASAEVLRDGWFATGDLGALDEDGYLVITGRKKDLLVTSGGKNVSPAVLEDRLRSRPPVGQCLVVGDNRPFIGALVTLDPEAVRHWLTVRKRPVDTPVAVLAEDPELLADVQKAVDHANRAVSRAESIRRFRVVPGEFSEENGMLTPSLKVKRHAVLAAYGREVDALYR
ncbi:AMP-dependent synthetase/ligase [Streptomyces sp. NPDC047981]|uniref:AMP-dependent synthetase/ligase n=1 Tax=Streptomyces sp. NPDC047981 TaxID=3154610 RepID=UPI00343E5D56